MKKRLYSIAEIAKMQISGMPKSKSNVIARAKREGWRFEMVYRQGGEHPMYELPDKYLPGLGVSEHGKYAKDFPASQAVDVDGYSVDVSEFSFVPRYEFGVSAGHGALPDREQIKDVMSFRKDWLRKTVGINSLRDLLLITVKGDSMEPDLKNQDTILIDKGKTHISDGFYIIRLGVDVLVKRLQRLGGSRLRIVSSNVDAYPPFEIDMSDESLDFQVIGRVVWFGRTI
ncbi:MAG: helix-turn-helix transcriptional regulator [Burkholderiales bacterium]|jgi:phage repressor protein C with HTH and peptisase S24 domain|nr:helix-turn-helix transcriptional regulator [Burkholderiales bacterium]